MLDIRYIYLLKIRRSNRYKIGISRAPNERLSSIQRSIPKKTITIVRHARVCLARDLEHYLHTKYEEKHSPLKNVGAGAGKTEWFTLTYWDVLKIRLIFLFHNFVYYLYRVAIIATLIDILILIYE